MDETIKEHRNDYPGSDLEEYKKKSRKKWLLLLLLLLLIGAGGGYFLYQRMKPQSRYDLDRHALEGFLPGKTPEEIENELNRVIEEGYFNVSVNSQMVLENNKLDLRLENVPANHYYMQANIYLFPHEDSEEDAELIYESGVIKQGQYIMEADAKTSVKPGLYNGKAIVTALTPDDKLEDMGAAATNILIRVK